MKQLMMLTTLVLMSVPALALSPQAPVEGRAIISEVTDGDTFDLVILDFATFNEIAKQAPPRSDKHLNRNAKIMTVRLASVDTAELGTREGDRIARKARTRLSQAEVSFRCYEYGHYGRPICHVSEGGQDIGHWLIKNGMSDYIDQYGHDPFLHRLYRQAEQ